MNQEKYFHKVRCLLFSLLVITFCFSGCNNNKSTADNINLSSSSMPDFQYMFKRDGVRSPTQKSNQGYYNVLNNHIIYTEATTMESVPLCNKTNCLHDEDFPECNALIGVLTTSFDNFQIYNDNIYCLIESSIDEEDDVELLLRVSLDGSKKSIVLSLTNKFIIDWFIYDGYFYYQPSINISSDSENETATVSGDYYRINLQTKSDEKFIDFTSIDGVYGAEGSMRNVYDGYLYLTVYGYTSEEAYNQVISGKKVEGEIPTTRKILRYSLDDVSYQIIDPYQNDYEFIGFSDGKLIGKDENKICVSELDGTKPKTIFSVDYGSSVCCDDDYIYVYNIGNADAETKEPMMFVYDKNGNKISTALIPNELSNFILTAPFGDDNIFMTLYLADGVQTLNYIVKNDLLNDGELLKYHEIYRYE